MPPNHGQGNARVEAGDNATSSSKRDSHLLGRKRKPSAKEADINQSAQQAEQSYVTFNPDDSDGDVTGVEVRGDHHVFKKQKATTSSLLSGTPMEKFYVVPSMIDSPPTSTATFPAVAGDQHLRNGKSKSSSISTETRLVQHLVNDCIANTASTASKEKGYIEARAQAGLSRNRSDETTDTLDSSDHTTEDSFIIVPSGSDRGSQAFPAYTDSVPPPINHIPATRSQITRLSPKHEVEKATHTNEVEVGENTHERSNRGGVEDLIAQSHNPDSAYAYGSGEGMMPAGGTLGPPMLEIDAEALIDNRSKPDDGEYEFVEHPEPYRIRKFREVAANVKGPDGNEYPVIVCFDNSADSNFISSSLVGMLGFHERPLLPEDIVKFTCLVGSCMPEMYVALELQPRGLEYYRESFRVVENDAFDLIIGAATIEARDIQLQEQIMRSAFPSFKKDPTPEQAAAQKASSNRDRQRALELSKNIPPYKNIPPVIQSSSSEKKDPRNPTNSPATRPKG